VKLAIIVISQAADLQNIHQFVPKFKLTTIDKILNESQIVIHFNTPNCDKLLQDISILKLYDFEIKAIIIQYQTSIDNYKSILTQLKCYDIENIVIGSDNVSNSEFVKILVQKLIINNSSKQTVIEQKQTTNKLIAPSNIKNDNNDISKQKHGREKHKGHLIGRYLQSPSMLFSRDSHNIWMGDMYRGRSAFLILGGPSFAQVDKTKLNNPGILTMGVNNSVKSYRPNMWVSVDDPSHFIKSIWLDPKITKFVPFSHTEKTIFDNEYWKETTIKVGDCPNAWYFKRNENFVAEQYLFEDTINWGNHKDFGGGRSVMLAAIRILYYLGIRTIYLLGCDFKMDEQSKYHFDQDRSKSSIKGNASTYKLLIDRFTKLKPILDENGLEVFNCNQSSGLTVFPFVDFNDAIRIASSEMPLDIENERTNGLYDRLAKIKEAKEKEAKEKEQKIQ
jgi:hypothetical protein